MKLSSSIFLHIAKRIPVGYWKLIRFVAANDPALWDYPIRLARCPGREMRADLRETVYTGLFREGAIPHQMGFDKVVTRLLRPGDVVYDVGANVGYTSLLFSALVGDGGQVISLEPVPRSFELLYRSCRECKNIICLNVAASNTSEDLLINASTMLDRSSAKWVRNTESIRVPADTLDSLVEMHGFPKLVKIDVEGFESAVFRGMKNILGRETPPMIIFEALDESSRLESESIIELYAAASYSFYRIGHDGILEVFDNPIGSSDYLALPNWALDRVS